MLGLVIASPVVRAEDQIEKEVQTETEQTVTEQTETEQTERELPAADDKKETPDTEGETPNKPQNGPSEDNTQTELGNGLEIGPEIVGDPLGAAVVPKVNKISIGDKTVSGKLTMGAGQRKAKELDFTIKVVVNRKAGGKEEKSITIPHTVSNQNWIVSLDSELLEGDTVSVTQAYGGEESAPVVNEVTESLSIVHKDALKMPTGEIWIEQYVANIVSEEEKAEAIQMIKDANKSIADDIKSVEFKITGVDPKTASYRITYKDDSKSDEIKATNLTVKQVTEKSQIPNIEKVYVTNNQVKITFKETIKKGTKITLVTQFTDSEEKNFVKAVLVELISQLKYGQM